MRDISNIYQTYIKPNNIVIVEILCQNYDKVIKFMNLDHTDRIYKTIDAKICTDKFIRILSKIDEDGIITVEFYNYHREDIDKEGHIKNKRGAYITGPISKDKFNDMIDKFSLIYPEFKIIGMTDFSNMTLKEAIEIIESEGYGKIIHYE